MPLYPHGTGIKPSAALPNPYTFKLNASTGRLELWKNGKLIQTQDETGSWITMGVSTGTGSLHIGELHSNGSGGENVVWVNEDSAVAYFPSWAGVSKDGASAFSATVREHGALTSAEPNGAVSNGTSVDYLATFTSPADVAFFYIEIIPAETYAGRVMWKADKGTGKEVAAFFLDINAVSGTRLVIPFKYPLWAKFGQSFTVSITKDDGTYLKVRGGATAPAQPYRKTFTRTFTDYNVHHEGKPAAIARSLEALTGSDQLNPSALRALTASKAAVTDNNGKLGTSSVTSTELAVLSGATATTNTTIVATDGVVVNDGGVMKQCRAQDILDYTWKPFQGGAIPPYLTQKLPLAKVLVSDNNGDLAASNVKSSELDRFVGQTLISKYTRQTTTYGVGAFNSVRNMSLNLAVAAGSTNVAFTYNGTASNKTIRYVSTYGHSSLATTYSCGAVASGTTIFTFGAASGRGWVVDVLAYCEGDIDSFMNVRLIAVDETASLVLLYVQVW